MLDLSEEKDEENIATCVKYFTRMAKMKIWLEMEIGITGGEEDGVDNTGRKADELYTTPQQACSLELIRRSFISLVLGCSEVKYVRPAVTYEAEDRFM